MAPEVRREVVMERSAVSCWVEIAWVIVGRYFSYGFQDSGREIAIRSVNQSENFLRLEGHGQVKKLFLLLHFEADNAFNTKSSPNTDFGS